MNIRVQNDYKNELKKPLDEVNQEATFFQLNNKNAELLVGDADFIKESATLKILVTQESDVDPQKLLLLSQKSKLYVVKAGDEKNMSLLLKKIKQEYEKNAQVDLIKSEIQKKRKNLETLNEKLSSESQKKIESLERSHIEESEKNQKEKSLLHFLDFVQAESTEEDFVEKIFRFIWKDLKKIGRLKSIGLSVNSSSGKAKILFYDGVGESTTLAAVDFSSGKVSAQLASVWGRPVGKIFSWVLPESSRESHLFIEVVDQQLSAEKISHYFNERIAVLSMYIDRWMIEKEIEVVVDRWENTFKSFSGYTHVVDENFRIYQANYPHQQNDVCYKVLAKKNSPCESCPIIKNKNTQFLLTEDMSVKTYFSQFKFQQKKYNFLIYEDITKLNQLHSHIIQTEKMSTLGRLGNHLAHELNNPLTGIKSYVQTLLTYPDEKLPQNAKSDLTEIMKAAVRCQKIIKNFIDFSQKKEPTLEKVRFSEVVDNTVILLKTALRSHRLFIDLKDDLVLANSHDLQQVLFNLIKNSCQAMQSNGSIKIYKESTSEKNIFFVEDTGPGFSEEILKNIFQPFMTTKKQGEGTGLGLYLSKKLINNMGAELQISSSSKGAKISLIFDKVT